jgi:shikimate dehydrogenase
VSTDPVSTDPVSTDPVSTDPVAAGARRFVDAEINGTGLTLVRDGTGPGAAAVDIGAIGTVAATAVRGQLLAEALVAAGWIRRAAVALADPDALVADPSWQLGVVLSPWKRQVGDRCDLLAPSAALTGVVDTVVRTPAGAVGFNTNTWAAMSALEVLSGGRVPPRLLLLGAGASARSVALAVMRLWPDCEMVVAARSPAQADDLAQAFDAQAAEDIAGGGYGVVVNTTTWGETEASEAEPFSIDLDGVLAPGVGLFDLNNRVGALPIRALAAGCAVVSGAVMQRVTNASRSLLVHYAIPGP